jgi:hypothetical protein
VAGEELPDALERVSALLAARRRNGSTSGSDPVAVAGYLDLDRKSVV